MKTLTVLELLQSGVHFGHQKSRWHPRMREFVFAERNGVHIIDLEKTLIQLQKALDFLEKTAASGGTVLFVGTKKQGKKIMEKYAKECGMPYVVERWIGGMFTNFANVSKLIKKYKDLQEKKESGALNKYTKKERSDFDKEIEKLKKLVGGLAELKKIPEAVFILDAKREKTAIVEARNKKVKVVGLCDTNVNPDFFDYPIPANDDAVKSIELVVSLACSAVNEGKSKIVNN